MALRLIFRALLIILAFTWWVISFSLLVCRNRAAPVNSATFPIQIQDSGLVLQSMFSYDQSNLTNGDNNSIMGATAAIIYNNASNIIYSAIITVEAKSAVYKFELTMLPPQQSVLVFDLNENLDISLDIMNIDLRYETLNVTNSKCSFKSLKDNRLAVSNYSENDIDEIHIYHKNWDDDRKMYIGSDLYKTEIHNLKAGDTVIIDPGRSYPVESKLTCIIERPGLLVLNCSPSSGQ